MDTKDAPQIVNYATASVTYVPHAACWLPDTTLCVAAGEAARRTGDFEIYALQNGELCRQKHRETKAGIKSLGVAQGPGTNICIAASHFNGELTLWDSEDFQREIWKTTAHKGICNSVDCHPTSPLIITGGSDGVAKVWDLRAQEAVVSLEPVAGEDPTDCWCVCWGGCEDSKSSSICSGYDNGDVKIFDLRAMKLLTEQNLDYGVCGMACDRKDIQLNKLLCATLEGNVFTADLRTQHPEDGFTFRQQHITSGTVWGVYPLPQNREIAAVSTASGTLSLLLYKYPEERRIKDAKTGLARGVVGLHEVLNDAEISSQPIMSWDWHPQKLGLGVSAALDQSIRVTVVTKLNLY